ncbi:hypothetical protein FHU33_4234 [Blastococcus colisei]|uniref:Uncharacterized protein n=1 Tax=Blastococcus colisei TaxID=1564162 RepID=A0A543P0E1_9ACTN|nr:hypothetical protein [Blastococcus colisei]TQN37576.1 hypothetical protein FHU33_4234 [Blastococcus colisei]
MAAVLDTFAAPQGRAAVRAAVETPATTRRVPLAVVGAGVIGVVEAIALLAVSLTGLDGLLSAGRAPGWLVAVVLVVLAGWIVLCAGSAAAMVDGAGRSLLTGVAYAEMGLVAGLLVVATVTPFVNPTSLPVPALGLLALAVPVGKLLLAGAPSAERWIAQGPRARTRRPDPVQAHRLLATVTLGAIGFSLCAVAVLEPVPAGDVGDPASVVYSQD